MEIYLIRHTTPKIGKGICYGQTDLDLDLNYQEEFNKIFKTIPKGNYKIYSSPLKRCATLAHRFSNNVIYDNRLKELHFGDWEMQPWDKIATDDITPWMDDFVNVTVPNGESYIELKKRVNHFFLSIKNEKNKNLIIITHSGVIRAYLASLLNIPLKDSFSISIKYGDIFKLKKTDDSIKILSNINYTSKE